jgi:hypothetical protein
MPQGSAAIHPLLHRERFRNSDGLKPVIRLKAFEKAKGLW